MNGTQDQQTALLREELAKLLATLNHNREKVSLDVLKTKYKKAMTPYAQASGALLRTTQGRQCSAVSVSTRIIWMRQSPSSMKRLPGPAS